MIRFVIICAIGVAFGAAGYVGPTKADIIDPEFTERLPAVSTTTTCASNCFEEIMGLDPISGITTLEYVFTNAFDKTAAQTPITSVVAGDLTVKVFGTSQVGDVIRFENLNVGGATGSGMSAVAFIFSADISGGLAADVGLPSTLQALTGSISENTSGQSTVWFPTSGQPGFCACATVGYGIMSVDLIPEPGTLAILSLGLLGTAAARRWKQR
jgi:PEP-CTERM motif